ncbi:MAG: endonuclease/exonuclease/phosphatase family protein [Pseudomonadota bacterium]
MPDPDPHTLTCTTWNIHRGRGNDGHVDADRTLDILRDEVWRAGTDALFLQEADAEAPPHRGVLDVARVEAITGLKHVQAEDLTRNSLESHGFLGVVAYLHPEIEVQDLRWIDLAGHCPRGAVVIDVLRLGKALRFVVTHLSLGQVLRILQMRTIGQHLQRYDARPVILCGDLNEWRPWGGLALSRRVVGQALHGPARATFPIRRPVLPLDRVLVSAPHQVETVKVLDGPGIRMASDHRPLTARVQLVP